MNFILNQMLNYNIINLDEVEEYKYALRIIYLKVLHYLIIFCMGIMLNILLETFMFLFAYIICRTYIGGYHAKNSYICACLSSVFILVLDIINQLIRKVGCISHEEMQFLNKALKISIGL